MPELLADLPQSVVVKANILKKKKSFLPYSFLS
jgi:hypothetical protein